jgi:hypothetical protein
MVNTKHFVEERQSRELLIENVINDANNVICTNVLDRGHKNGAERFELTDKAIIKVYNVKTDRHITDLIARPKQVYDRLGDAFMSLDINVRRRIINLARKHQELGYNNL